MRFISLFTGIGGIDLGLERAGMTCVAQVENDPYCNKILNKHWPDVPKYGDIHDVKELPHADLIAGGFPCQPVSLAGKRKGTDDERWLWPQFARIIRLVRPRYVLVENTSGLLSRGMGDILGDLAQIGYDAEWDRLSACNYGASHMRRRVFIVAYSNSSRRNGWTRVFRPPGRPELENRRSSWPAFTELDRTAYGIPGRTLRLRALGNAVVPQVAQHIGELIQQHHDELVS